MGTVKSQKLASLQSLRSDNIISNKFCRSFAYAEASGGAARAPLGSPRTSSGPSDRFLSSGRTCTLGEKFPHGAKLVFPQAFQAGELEPRRCLLTTFGVVLHAGQLEISS